MFVLLYNKSIQYVLTFIQYTLGWEEGLEKEYFLYACKKAENCGQHLQNNTKLISKL